MHIAPSRESSSGRRAGKRSPSVHQINEEQSRRGGRRRNGGQEDQGGHHQGRGGRDGRLGAETIRMRRMLKNLSAATRSEQNSSSPPLKTSPSQMSAAAWGRTTSRSRPEGSRPRMTWTGRCACLSVPIYAACYEWTQRRRYTNQPGEGRGREEMGLFNVAKNMAMMGKVDVKERRGRLHARLRPDANQGLRARQRWPRGR